MLSRMFYFLRETGISLWRNVSMTIAAILTIFVTLSLVGVAMLVFFWNSAGTKNVEKSVQYEVFLVSKADETQIKTVKDQIETDKKKNLVVNYEFITKDQAWEFFKREFKDEKDTLKSVDKDVLPVSFIIAPKDPKLLDSLVAKYSAIPGVENVTKADFKDEIRRANLINQTLSVFALISAFIFKTVILDDTFSGKGFRGFFVTSSDLLLTILLVLFAGIAVGFVSSYLGLKRYLDV